MATRKWHTHDGEAFDTKAQADEHEARTELLKQVAQIANGTPDAILAWFEKNFRVPATRAPRKPKTDEVA